MRKGGGGGGGGGGRGGQIRGRCLYIPGGRMESRASFLFGAKDAFVVHRGIVMREFVSNLLFSSFPFWTDTPFLKRNQSPDPNFRNEQYA